MAGDRRLQRGADAIRPSSAPSAHAEDRPAIFAAHFALSHACWLICYPLAGRFGAAMGLQSTFVVMSPIGLAGGAGASAGGSDPSDLAHDHPNLSADHPHCVSTRDQGGHPRAGEDDIRTSGRNHQASRDARAVSQPTRLPMPPQCRWMSLSSSTAHVLVRATIENLIDWRAPFDRRAMVLSLDRS